MCKPFKKRDDYTHVLFVAKERINWHITPNSMRLDRVMRMDREMLEKEMIDSCRIDFLAERDGGDFSEYMEVIENGLWDAGYKYDEARETYKRKRGRKTGVSMGKYPKANFKDDVLERLDMIIAMLEDMNERDEDEETV